MPVLAHSQHEPLVIRFFCFETRFFLQGKPFSSILGDERRRGAEGKDHHHGGIEDLGVEDAGLITDGDDRQGACCRSVSQTEHELSLYRLHAEVLLGNPCGYPFTDEFGSNHHHRDDKRRPAVPDQRGINQKTYT